jgi:hypothetical protein
MFGWLDKGPYATPFIVFFSAVIVGAWFGASRSWVGTLSVTIPNIPQIVENKSSGEMAKPFDVSLVKPDFFEGRGSHMGMPGVT